MRSITPLSRGSGCAMPLTSNVRQLSMKRRLALATTLALAGGTRSAGLGASDYGFLDGLNVDDRSHAASLLLVIDRPLEDGLTKPKVRHKLLAYHDWVFVRQGLVKAYPQVNVAAGVSVLMLHSEPKSALGKSVLEQLIGYAKELQFQPTARLLPTKA